MHQNDEINNQRRMIKTEGNRWGFTGVISNVAIAAVSIGMMAFLPERVTTFLNGATGQLIQQVLLTVLMFILPFALAAVASGKKIGSLISLRLPKFSVSAPYIMLSLGGAMVINVLVSQMVSLFNVFGLAPESPALPMPEGVGGIIFYTVTLSVVPAIVEEFAYRGMVLGALRRFGDGFAILASSLLFGLVHGNLVQIPFAAVLGCLLGYVAVVCDSIWPAVAVHFLNNLLAAVQSIALEYCSETVASIITAGSMVLYIIIGINGLIILCKRSTSPFAPLKHNGLLTPSQALKTVCLSPGYIASFVYFGGTACLYLLMSKIGGI